MSDAILGTLYNAGVLFANPPAGTKIAGINFDPSTGAATSSQDRQGRVQPIEGGTGGIPTNPTLPGVVTADGSMIVTPHTVVGNVIDMDQGQNNLLLTGATQTLTMTSEVGEFAEGQSTLVRYANDVDDCTVTLPAGTTWLSTTLGENITEFVVPANKQGYFNLVLTATGGDVINEPQPIADESWNRTQTVGANVTKTLVAYAPRPGRIKAIYGENTAGAIDVKVRINGVDVTGATCTCDVVRDEGLASALNNFAIGAKVDLVYSGDAGSANNDVTVVWTPGGL